MHTTFDHVEFNGQFIRLGRRVRPYFEILRNGAKGKTIQEMIANDFGIALPDHEIKQFLEKIFLNSTLLIDIDEAENRFKIIPNRSETARSDKITIRMRITLIPEKWVRCIAEKLQFFYTKWAALCFCCLVAANIAMVSSYGIQESLQKIDSFRISEINLWITIPILVLSFIFHEIGHSTASLVGGCKPGRIGFGIYWIYPVLFSDVTKAWLLKPNKRILVDIGGIYFQSILTATIGIMIPFAGSTVEPSLLACVAYNMIAIFISANPALRYDGYWLIADYLDRPNLAALSRKKFLNILKRKKLASDESFNASKFKRYVFSGYLIFSWIFFTIFIFLLLLAIKSSFFLTFNELKNFHSSCTTNCLIEKTIKIFIYCIPLLFFHTSHQNCFEQPKALLSIYSDHKDQSQKKYEYNKNNGQ